MAEVSRILVVDDDPDIREVLRLLLSEQYIVAEAPDGLAEAVEMPDRRFVLAVQWHPESMSARVPVQQRLFDAFVRACEA